MEQSVVISQKKTDEILSLFSPIEGEVAFYYGRIRNGKTYAATSDILDLLNRGEVVYGNWPIEWNGFDERSSRFQFFAKLLFRKRYFFKYSPTNFHYFAPDDVDIPLLGRLVNVHIFIDEGQWILNSHVKDHDPETRKLILHNGHYCRSLNIISQRPVNVFKDMRSQVNVWYKCEKLTSFPWLIFKRTAYEDMVNDLPDETVPSRKPKVYFANKRVYDAYNTHAMRGKDAIDEVSSFEVFELNTGRKIKGLVSGKEAGVRLMPPPALPPQPLEHVEVVNEERIVIPIQWDSDKALASIP